MSLKRFRFSPLALAFAILAMSAGTAFAHTNMPQPGTHLTVAKAASTINPDLSRSSIYTTIQAAVNAAQPGQVIEILDEAEYGEQVTIEGREDTLGVARWTGVKGGKNGITIRYVPPSASAAARPSIKYQDITNQSPKTPQEAAKSGDQVGTSGNFETNGALRIIRAEGVKIEGIIVDGGGSVPFFYSGIWCGDDGKCYPLFHGNAAIAVAVSGNIQIRDCEPRNAYFGIAVKDRNTGGVFASRNPGDNDTTIALSGFGKTGYHLFEYNKIHDNSTGIYFESSWDRGSTVRYNLIYSNYHHAPIPAAVTSAGDDAAPPGGVSFKDNYLSPVAMYNNTFYDNAGHFRGHWQVGYQHLIFNNIFAVGSHRTNGGSFEILGKFPNRMKHNVIGGANAIQIYSQQNALCTGYRDSVYLENVQLDQLGLGNLTKERVSVQLCYTPNQPQAQSIDIIRPGAVIPGPTTAPFAAGSNNRWLEMAGSGTALPSLFKSVSPTSADFLVPDWARPEVAAYIRNGGWPTGGIVNEDGTVADLGAIPYSGKRAGDATAQKLRARVSPFSVVRITGTTATATILVDQEIGATGAMTIKYIRWVAPIPDNTNSWGNDGTAIPSGSIRTLTGAEGRAITDGVNNISFTVPALGPNDTTGFFEVVLQGANGTTDVGFLPYRKLEYRLDITVASSTAGCVTAATTTTPVIIQAGCPVSMTVRAMNNSTNQPFTGSGALRVEYNLALPAAKIWQTVDPSPGNALSYDPALAAGTPYSKTYTPVYFTKAGSDMISAAGEWRGGGRSLTFLGDLLVLVKPGAPNKVVFQQPIPNNQLNGMAPATIVGTYPVVVQVQDRFDNGVDVAVSVEMKSLQDQIGDVEAPKTVTVDTAMGENRGNANFTAAVTYGATGEIFNLVASGTGSFASIKPDTGSLRVGRATDGFRVFYYQSTPPKHGKDWIEDFSEVTEVNARTGASVQIWAKIRNNADTIVTSKSSFVCVTASDPNIQISLTEGGAPVTGTIPLTGGVAAFWITSSVAVDDASLSVVAKTSAGDCDGPNDGGVSPGSRGGITFTKPDGGVGKAFVKGDGNGRPTYVEITFDGDGSGGGFSEWKKPDSVTLQWPCASSPAVRSTDIEYLPDDVTLRAKFDPNTVFPEGYSMPGSGSGALVEVFGAIEAGRRGSPGELADSIGPLIARSRASCDNVNEAIDGGPTFVENLNRGVTADTLRLRITEGLRDTVFEGQSLWISERADGAGRTLLTVLGSSRDGADFKLVISPETPLTENYWIKLNDAHTGIVDAAGNRPQSDNRYVQITQKEADAGAVDGWYTTNDTGAVNAVYLTFNKSLTAADISTWFDGGSFNFSWAGGGVGLYSVNADNIASITIDNANQNTIRIDLITALSVGEYDKMRGGSGRIRTSGYITVTINFASGKGWASVSQTAYDKAPPVLIRAELHIGMVNENNNDQYDPDTLILTYSESMRDNISSVGDPAGILGYSCAGTGTWRLVPVAAGGTIPARPAENEYFDVRYVVNGEIETCVSDAPKNGDLVRINSEAGVTDGSSNVQGVVGNRPVPLKIIPGKPNWRPTVKNNPFMDFVVVEMTPNAKGDNLEVKGYISLYDNMGKLVLTDTIQNNPSVGNAVAWRWNGTNKSGRTVGTGTYLFKAFYTAKGASYDDKTSYKQAIGFVRGKK